MSEMKPFKLERYFAEYEFNAPYLLSASDCESLQLAELLAMADDDSLSLWRTLSLGYTESAGRPVLREAITGLYQNVTPEDILVMAPEETIFIFMHTQLSPGDEVVVVSPAYQSLYEVARSIGCKVVPWALKPTPDGWTVDIEQLQVLISSKTKLIVMNFPHNPTGCLISHDELKAIVEIASRKGISIFADEMYRGLEYQPAQRLPAMCDLYEGGSSLSGMSKSLSLPGLRIGWLASRDKALVAKWRKYKDYTTICSSAPSEVLALMALRARDVIVSRNLGIIQANLAAAEHFFGARTNLFGWLPPRAGSVAFIQWLGPGTSDDFCLKSVREQGVMVVPGSMFESDGQYFRIGLGRKNFSAALVRLENVL